MSETINLSISPCPNDTFVFHAMMNGLVDTEGMEYEVAFHDIDVLNRRACDPGSDEEVVKVSYAVLPSISDRFSLLSSGSALGYGNGPVVVSRRRISADDLCDMSIAVPGLRTTAAKLLSVLYPGSRRLEPMLFSEIAGAVASGRVDAGVLIHEGRFTYRDRGLRLVADLGEEWEAAFDMPIPLGAIVAAKSLGGEIAGKVARTIRRSIEFAFEHPEVSAEFVKEHAQELSDSVRVKHIEYFVNDFSLDLGRKGMAAVAALLGEEQAAGITLITGR